MKIITAKQQQEALEIINDIEDAVATNDFQKLLDIPEEIARLTYIVGGCKALLEKIGGRK